MGKLIPMRNTSDLKQGLKNLIDYPKINTLTVIEIGCYTGESSVIFAEEENVKHLYCVDPWLGGYDNQDGASKSDMKLVESTFDDRIEKYKNKITKIKKKSAEALDYFLDNDIKVDLVYIDGNHQEEAVTEDINNYKQIIKEGGYISGHDWQSDDVKLSIQKIFNKNPDKIFSDRSWIIKL